MPNNILRKSSSKKSQKKSKVKINRALIGKIVGLVFLSLALIILVLPQHLNSPKKSAKNPIQINSKLLSSKALENTPVRIIIPKSNIDLSIVSAKVVDGYWELSENTASYGLGSGYPGTASNTVIFAHARQGLFYNLKDVKTGDSIYVLTKDRWHRYKVNKVTTVFPNQIEVIQPTKTETITLYTCDGFYDEKRLIVTAVPQG